MNAEDVAAANELLTGNLPRYTVYVNDTKHYYSRARARFVRWVLTHVVGLTVSLHDQGTGCWLILQNSVERAGDENAEHASSVAHSAAETRSGTPR